MTKHVLLWACLGLLVPVSAEPVKIQGDIAVGPHSLVEVAVPAKGDCAVTWRVTPSKGITKAKNQPAGQLVFNGPPGTYQVDVIVIDWTAKTVTEDSITVTISGGASPDPKPVDPVIPDGKFKLARLMYDAGSAVPAKSRQAAVAIAANYEALAKKAAEYGDLASFLNATTDGNRKAIADSGASREDWLPAFTVLQQAAFKLYDAGNLNTPADRAAAWTEIATGLKAVK